MAEETTIFDVQSFSEDQWISVEQHGAEAAATKAAERLFAQPSYAGIRIIRRVSTGDGRIDGEVVFSEIREISDANLEIVPVDDAHLCTDIHDFYGLESRQTISRLMRKYINKVYLTPTEFLHNYRALQNIKAYGQLLEAGVERVASLQAKMAGSQVASRRDKLHDVVTKITQRLLKANDSKLVPSLKGNRFTEVVDAAIGLSPDGAADFHAMVALCRDLVQHRSWLAKFRRVAQMAGTEPRDDVLALLDGVVADLFCLPLALDDILGFQCNLEQLLCSIADLCTGTFNPDKSEARDELALFLPHLVAGRMPQTQAALMDLLTRQVSGSQPLDRYDPSREQDAFRTVSARLGLGGEVLGGQVVADALRKRELAVFGPGGMPPARKGPRAAAPPADPRRVAAHVAELVAQGAEIRTYEPGSLIFRQGSAADHAFMVVAGQVEITTLHRKKLVLLARLGEDALFGEMALFSANNRSATATTLGGCQLRVISAVEMNKRIESLDPFCQYWLQYLIGRITDLSGRVEKANSGQAA